jgi:hypothetical protein
LAGRKVPFDVNTLIFVASHDELDPVELLENIAEMVKVFKPNILYPKIVNNETELDGTPFMAPEAWGGFGFVISFSKQAGSEEIIGKNASLGKAITALANFEVNPTVTLGPWSLYSSEFRQNVCTYRVRHWSVKVEVLEIDGAETCAWAKHAVLLRSSLTSLSEAVLVPTSPGEHM